MREYDPVTITIHRELLQQFKDYCKRTKMPLSQFFSLSGQETVKRNGTQLEPKTEGNQESP